MHLVSLDIKNKDEEISQFLIIERLTMFQYILKKKLSNVQNVQEMTKPFDFVQYSLTNIFVYSIFVFIP